MIDKATFSGLRHNIGERKKDGRPCQVSPKVLGALLGKLERQERWVSDLQAGMYVNCVYCGHRYGPDDQVPVAMAEVLKEHIQRCPEHPLSQARERIRELKKGLKEAGW